MGEEQAGHIGKGDLELVEPLHGAAARIEEKFFFPDFH
jgi:hypothetical protein